MGKRDFYVYAGTLALLLAGFWFVRINTPGYIAQKRVAQEEKERKIEERRQNYEDTYTKLEIARAPVGKWSPYIEPQAYSYIQIRWSGNKVKWRSGEDWQVVLDKKNPSRKPNWPWGAFFFMSLDPQPQLVWLLSCPTIRCVDGIRDADATLKKYRAYYEKNTSIHTVTAPIGRWSQTAVPLLPDRSGLWIDWEHAGKVKLRITPTPRQPMGPYDYQTILAPTGEKHVKTEYTGDMYFMSLEENPVLVTIRQCPGAVCTSLWAEWLKS